MKDTMLLDVRRRNGVHDKYTTNDNECMNSKFKKHVNHKASDLPKFIRDVKEFVRSDQTVIESAFSGTGDFQFVEELKTFNIGSKWWSLSPVKRTAHFNRFMEACKHKPSSEVVTNQADEQSTSTEFVPRESPVAQPVSMPDVNVACDVLRGILDKAEKLVQDDLVSEIRGQVNKQVAIASQTDVYPRIVIREDRKRRGENVVELKCGPGRGCLNFSTHGMCSHTQAASLVWHVKEEYWRFLETSKKVGTSLHSLAKHGLPDGSGKKENQINRGKSTGKTQKRTNGNTGTASPQPSAPETSSSQSTQGNTDTITACNVNVSVHQPTVRRPEQLPVQGQGRGVIVDQGVPSVVQGRIPTPMPIYPTPQPGQFLLYLLQFCPRQVSICFGCSQSLKVNGIICEPPHDLLIVSNMMRGYMHNGEHI